MRLIIVVMSLLILCGSAWSDSVRCDKRSPQYNFSPKRTKEYLHRQKPCKGYPEEREVKSWFNKNRRRRKRSKSFFQWIGEVDRKFKENFW